MRLLIDQPPDLRLRGNGHRRTVIGNVVQELVCRMMDWQPSPLDGRQVFCPDAITGSGKPVEIKSVSCGANMNGKSVIYDWRMRKEALHAPELLYAFFCYPARTSKRADTLAEFLDRLATQEIVIAVVQSLTVHRLARLEPLRVLDPRAKHDKRNGYARKGYVEGYRNLPIQPFCKHYYVELNRAHACWGRTFKFRLTYNQ